MSWLAGIAGKAEELLNKVDQAAATSLHNESESEGRGRAPPPNLGGHSKSKSSGGQLTGITGSISSSSSVPSNLNKINSSQDYLSQTSPASTLSKLAKPSASRSTGNVRDRDDALFEFLNSTQSVSDTKKTTNGKTKPLMNKQQHSRQSSGSSAGSRDRKIPETGSQEDSSSVGTPGK